MKDIKKNKKKHSYGVTIFVFILLIVIMVYIYMLSDAQLYVDDMSFGEIMQQVTDSKSSFRGVDRILELVYGNDDSQCGTGSGTITNGTLQAKEHGQLITDVTLNPSGLPLYDGWTMDINKLKVVASEVGVDPNSIKVWDSNYKQFWSDASFQNNSALYGMGDFTNSTGRKTMISYNRAVGSLLKGAPGLTTINTNKGKVTLYDNRVLFAVPGRVFTDPELLTTEVLERVKGLQGLNISSAAGSSRDYSNGCYKVTYNGYENMVHDWSNCVPNNTGWKGIYFDVLFDDGTVLGGIMADGKGVHVGSDSRGSYCLDPLCEGYGQVRFTGPSESSLGYMSCLEIYSPGAINNGLDINLESKKIVGIRTYKVNGKVNGSYIDWYNRSSSK